QFAFAIWDSKEKELFLARDRVGIRPIYYSFKDDSILFASEIKAILMDTMIPRELDPIALDQIFTFWTTLPGRTTFKGIEELPPGHFLKISHGKVSMERYWDFPFFPPEEQLNWTLDDFCQETYELLEDAIRIRLRADVPVGCYLSGGLDSSGLAALVIRKFNSEAKTFGICFEEEAFDERDHQELMVSFLNAKHKALVATNEMIGTSFPDTLWHCEKPLLRTAPVPLFLLSQLVNKNDIKVVVTGEGADEVFAGYNIFREAKVRRFWSEQPESEIRASLIGRLYPYIFDNPRLKNMLLNFFGQGLDKVNDPFFSHLIRWNNTSRIKKFFSEELKETIRPNQSFEQLKQILPESYNTWDYLSKAQYLEMLIFLSNYLLSSQGDRVAMAHCLEIRLPYLDYRIIEFMGRVPSKIKIMGLNEKHILKKTFQRILPKEICKRPKHPYRAPIKRSLLNKRTLTHIEDGLSDRQLKKAGLFDIPKVRLLLKKLQTVNDPGEVESMALVGILSSQIIFDQFIERFHEYANKRSHKAKSLKVFDKRRFNSKPFTGISSH
ncbi:MAG: asparagine synthase (glutamine-hydrolyzing), partial [Desulfobacteraceae bacterium]